MLRTLIDELERSRFYGTLELKFEAGKIVLVRKSETFKPTQTHYGDNRGTGNEHDN